MSFAWATTTLAAHFTTAWKETDVVLGGEPFPEPDPARPFVVIEVEGDSADTLGIAGDGLLYVRQPITVTIDVFTSVTEGRARPLELADAAGLVLARLTLGSDGPQAPGVTTLVPSTSGPWPARGTVGYLNARCEIEGHVDFWSARNAG